MAIKKRPMPGAGKAQPATRLPDAVKDAVSTPKGRADFRKAMYLERRARTAEQQPDSLFRGPNSLTSVAKARALIGIEKAILAPLGSTLGRAVYDTRRALPGQKLKTFSSVLLGAAAASLSRKTIIGEYLGNSLRKRISYPNDPEMAYKMIHGNFVATKKDFEAIHKEIDQVKGVIKSVAKNVDTTVKGVEREFVRVKDEMVSSVQKVEDDTKKRFDRIAEWFKKLETDERRKNQITDYENEGKGRQGLAPKNNRKDPSNPDWVGDLVKYAQTGVTAAASAGLLAFLYKVKRAITKIGVRRAIRTVAGKYGWKKAALLVGRVIGMAVGVAATGGIVTFLLGMWSLKDLYDAGNEIIKEAEDDTKTSKEVKKSIETEKKPQLKGPMGIAPSIGLWAARKALGKKPNMPIGSGPSFGEREKARFLKFGALPEGFEFAPGHMGRLGNPAAVAARGAMPLYGMPSGSGLSYSGPSGPSGTTPSYSGPTSGPIQRDIPGSEMPSSPAFKGPAFTPREFNRGDKRRGTIPSDFRGGNFPTEFSGPSKVLSGQRQRFLQELGDPNVRMQFFATILSEQSSDAGRMAVMETLFNRMNAHGQKTYPSVMSALGPLGGKRSYYEPRRSGGTFWKSMRRLQSDPKLVEKFEGYLSEVVGGSNYSNYGTHNSSAGVARRAFYTQIGTQFITGELYSRKSRPGFERLHGAGTIRKEGDWFKRTIEAERAAKKPSDSVTPHEPGSSKLPPSTDTIFKKATGTPGVSDKVYLGDSVADGLAKAKGAPTDFTKVGKNPEFILKRIQGILSGNPEAFKGKQVILSSGLLNDPRMTDVVKKQIELLKSAGASIQLAGGPIRGRKSIAGVGSTLEKIAGDFGIPFLGNYKAARDRVHPHSYKDYGSGLIEALPTTKKEAGQIIAKETEKPGSSGKRIVDAAMKIFGLHEDADRKKVQAFLAGGGHDINPGSVPWCTAFVNASLRYAGVKPLNSLTATDYMSWGDIVKLKKAEDIRPGDILVAKFATHGRRRGQPLRRGETGGHIGIATGKFKVVGGRIKIEEIGGNVGDRVLTRWRDASSLIIRRAGEKDQPADGDIKPATSPGSSFKIEDLLTGVPVFDSPKPFMSGFDVPSPMMDTTPLQKYAKTVLKDADKYWQPDSTSLKQSPDSPVKIDYQKFGKQVTVDSTRLDSSGFPEGVPTPVTGMVQPAVTPVAKPEFPVQRIDPGVPEHMQDKSNPALLPGKAAPIQEKEPEKKSPAPAYTPEKSGPSRGTPPPAKFDPETRPAEPGSGGYGSYGRCFV